MRTEAWVPIKARERRRLSLENEKGLVGNITQSLRAKRRLGCRGLSECAREARSADSELTEDSLSKRCRPPTDVVVQTPGARD